MTTSRSVARRRARGSIARGPALAIASVALVIGVGVGYGWALTATGHALPLPRWLLQLVPVTRPDARATPATSVAAQSGEAAKVRLSDDGDAAAIARNAASAAARRLPAVEAAAWRSTSRLDVLVAADTDATGALASEVCTALAAHGDARFIAVVMTSIRGQGMQVERICGP